MENNIQKTVRIELSPVRKSIDGVYRLTARQFTEEYFETTMAECLDSMYEIINGAGLDESNHFKLTASVKAAIEFSAHSAFTRGFDAGMASVSFKAAGI